ncbi:helicase [Fragilaria crotonensis]|nr:helicase [Fragilaria crotonensis]
MAAITTRNREQKRQTRLEHLQRSQEGDPVAVTQMATITTRNREQKRQTRLERLQRSQEGDPVAVTQMAAITTQHQENMRQTRLERLQRSQEGDPVAATQMAAITTQHQEQMRQTRLERLQRSQEGDPVAATQMAAITTQHQEHMRQTRLERLQRSQEGDPVAATQMAAITTRNQEQMRQTRLERLQRSQEGDPVAATQMAAITTQHQEHMRQTRQSCQRTNGAAYSSAPAPALEQGRLNFIRLNQPRLRAELYQGIADAVAGEDVTNTRQLGRRIILPSSHIGSARNMHQLCQDALAIVRRMGKPDLFITMTTNPQWPEVVENLLPGQTVNDRPDLVARVFHLKFTEMMFDLQKRQVLGRVVAAIYTINFRSEDCHMHMYWSFGRE